MSTGTHHSEPGASSATGPGTAFLGSVVPLETRLTLSVAEVADLCGVSKSTVRRWIEQGLPTIPHMREQRIARARLDQFLGGVAA